MSNKDYRVRNWKEYNKALVNRGSITFWFNNDCLKQWQAPPRLGKRGRPIKYSDKAIECGLTLKALYKLTFRSTEGFIRSLLKLLKMKLDTPDYSSLCKRQKKLSLTLPNKRISPGKKLHIVVDTTGLKVYGEGEWKVRQHGWIKHRLWRKLHLAVNESTQGIEAFALTDLGVQDCEGLPLLVKQIKSPLGSCKGDGGYDRFSCYEVAESRHFKLVAPPQKNAKTSAQRTRNRKKGSAAAVKKRDHVVTQVQRLGKKEWKVRAKYHRRSLAETAMFRIKTLLGSRLSTRTLEHQQVEAGIWCRIINQMTKLGMPISKACA